VNVPLWVAIPVILFILLAAREDLRTRKIPNLITGPAFLLGLAVHLAMGGPNGLLGALVAGVLAGALLLPGWLMKFMGAGDVKLMAAIGAWLGSPRLALYAALFSLVAGGVISIVYTASRPAGTGPYWGLRWAGNHVAALEALRSAGKLTWNRGPIGHDPSIFYTQGATHVGYPLAGSVFVVR